MTAPARISQADITRAIKAAAQCGLPARVILRLQEREIEIIFGNLPSGSEPIDDWTDDDV